jgi:osmotically-inducible protein OsmY
MEVMRALLILALLVFIAGSAYADGGAGLLEGAMPQADFERLDRNRDGYVSRIEAIADKDVAKRFAQFDLDKDGRLSQSEYALVREDVDKRILLDAVLTARVKAALLAESGLASFAISVASYEGMVMLSGFVGSPDMASRAGRVTRTVGGVRQVENNIAVRLDRAAATPRPVNPVLGTAPR